MPTTTFNLSPDGTNFLTFPNSSNDYVYNVSVAHRIAQDFKAEVNPASNQMFYGEVALGALNFYCNIGASKASGGTGAKLDASSIEEGSSLVVTEENFDTNSWILTSEKYLKYNTTNNPALYAVIENGEAKLSTTPQKWDTLPLHILSLTDVFDFIPHNDTTQNYLSAVSSGDHASLVLNAISHAQIWSLTGGNDAVDGVFSSIQLKSSNQLYLTATALDEPVTCDASIPGGSWKIEDLGDGFATMEYLENGGTAIGYLTNNNGSIVLASKSASNNGQKWKFTSAKGKGGTR